MEDYNQQNRLNIPAEIKALFDRNGFGIRKILREFSPITLKEMDDVKLMNRVDTKFLLHINDLPGLLEKAKDSYRVLSIKDELVSPYTTIYYDTKDTDMYRDHHNGKRSRYKVRTRTYLKSKISFLEIKKKNNKNRVAKSRVRIPLNQFVDMELRERDADFIADNSPYITESIEPVLQNYFQRITLVDNDKTERITIDLGVYFLDIDKSRMEMEKDLVVVEMKQNRANRSKFRNYLSEAKIHPAGMSKYCLGMILLNPKIKHNRFKTKLRKINKLNQNNYVTN